MKTFKQYFSSMSKDEIEWIKSHDGVNVTPDANGNGDDLFNASKIKQARRKPDHGYETGEDEKQYDAGKSKDVKEENLNELSRHGIISRYLNATNNLSPEEAKKRKAGRKLAGMKKWGDKDYGLPEPKVKATDESVEHLDEALKLVKTHTSESGKKQAKVYKDNEWNEHRVKFFTDGKHEKDADYHTDDSEDAHDTAKHWIKEDVEDRIVSSLSQRYLNKIKPSEKLDEAKGLVHEKTYKKGSRSVEIHHDPYYNEYHLKHHDKNYDEKKDYDHPEDLNHTRYDQEDAHEAAIAWVNKKPVHAPISKAGSPTRSQAEKDAMHKKYMNKNEDGSNPKKGTK